MINCRRRKENICLGDHHLTLDSDLEIDLHHLRLYLGRLAAVPYPLLFMSV